MMERPQPLLPQGFQHCSMPRWQQAAMPELPGRGVGGVFAIKQTIAQFSPDELAELQQELKQQRLQRQQEELTGSCALTSISMPGSSSALAQQQPSQLQHPPAALPPAAFDRAQLENISEELRAAAQVLQPPQQANTWRQQQQQRCDAPRGSSSPQEHFNNYAAAAQQSGSAAPDTAADTAMVVYQQQLARLQEVLNSSAFAAAPSSHSSSAPAAADEHTCAVLELLRQVEKALRAQLNSAEPLQHSAAGPPQAPRAAQQPPRSPQTPVLLHHQSFLSVRHCSK